MAAWCCMLFWIQSYGHAKSAMAAPNLQVPSGFMRTGVCGAAAFNMKALHVLAVAPLWFGMKPIHQYIKPHWTLISIHFQIIIALIGLQGVLATLEYGPHVTQSSSLTKRSCCDINCEKNKVMSHLCPQETSWEVVNKSALSFNFWMSDNMMTPPLVSSWSVGCFFCMLMLSYDVFWISYVLLCSFVSSHWTLIPSLSSCLLFISASKVLPEPWKGRGRFRKDKGPMTWVSRACFGAPGWWCLSFRNWNKIPSFAIIIPEVNPSQHILFNQKRCNWGMFLLLAWTFFFVARNFLAQVGHLWILILVCGWGAPPWILKSLGS